MQEAQNNNHEYDRMTETVTFDALEAKLEELRSVGNLILNFLADVIQGPLPPISADDFADWPLQRLRSKRNHYPGIGDPKRDVRAWESRLTAIGLWPKPP